MKTLQFSSSPLRVVILILALFVGASILQPPVLQARDSTSAQMKKSKVDVNSADLKTLETLPGIGPTLAQRIIDGRPYKNATDLAKVDGMSKSKVSALKKDITFGSGAAATASTAQKSSPSKSVAPTPTGSASGKLAAGEMININAASAGDLERLPGIGPTKAKAIVEYREQNGPFKSPEDVMNVKGIKSGEYSKLKDHIKLSD